MRKLVKIIYLIVIVLILIPSLYLGYRYQRNTTQVYPYPYKLNAPLLDEINSAQQADIILIGDSSTTLLNDSLDGFLSEITKYFKSTPKVYDWGRKGETAAQSLEKLKTLKKMPSLVIYHGGRDTLLNQKFNLRDFNILKKNLAITKDETLMTLAMAYPPLSRLIYHPLKKIEVSNQDNPYPKTLPPEAVLQIMDVLYQLYQMEVRELFTYLKEQDAKLWVIPQALNLLEPPHRVCENTIDLEQDNTIKKAQGLKESGQIKEAFNLVNDLVKTAKGNSKAYFFIGDVLMNMGNYKEAKKAYYQAMIYDCGLTRSNPIFLKILMEEAEKRQFKVIDFNRLVTNQLGHNPLFINDRDPQPLYYQQLSAIIKREFLKFIKQ